MKKTAVQNFALALMRAKAIKSSSTNDFIKANADALQMEKEQIIEAQENGFTDGCRYTTGFEQTLWHDGEQYYNETFKSE